MGGGDSAELLQMESRITKIRLTVNLLIPLFVFLLLGEPDLHHVGGGALLGPAGKISQLSRRRSGRTGFSSFTVSV